MSRDYGACRFNDGTVLFFVNAVDTSRDCWARRRISSSQLANG